MADSCSVLIDLGSIMGDVSKRFHEVKQKVQTESGFFVLCVRSEHEPIFRQLVTDARVTLQVVDSSALINKPHVQEHARPAHQRCFAC